MIKSIELPEEGARMRNDYVKSLGFYVIFSITHLHGFFIQEKFKKIYRAYHEDKFEVEIQLMHTFLGS